MTDRRREKQALAFTLLALAVLVAMQAVGLASGGAGAQEPFEIYAPPSEYAAALAAAAEPLRLVLLGDLFFMIGYGGALACAIAAHAGRDRLAARIGAAGLACLVALDIGENLVMLTAIDLVETGQALAPARIAVQAGLSGAKWFAAAITLVGITFLLPRNTGAERGLVWLLRLAMPAGAGLFVTGAFDLRMAGAGLIGLAMAGGLLLLALTAWARLRTNPAG